MPQRGGAWDGEVGYPSWCANDCRHEVRARDCCIRLRNAALPPPPRRTFVPHPSTVAPVTTFLSAALPHLDPTPVSSETCMYTMTPDEDFVIDWHPANRDIIVAAGFSGEWGRGAVQLGDGR